LRCEEKGGVSNDLLADRAPTAADPPPPPTPIHKQPSSGWYWVAGILAVLGLTAALVWGAVGTISALDEVDSFERTTVPGAVTVPVTDPGAMVVYYENPAELARYATNTPTWQQLRLTVTGPDGAVLVSTYRSTARYDVDPGRLGRAVAKFEAATAGQYRVSTARAVEPGATLAVGDNFARDIAMTILGAATLGLLTVVAAVLVAVVTYRARSRTIR
jgi:hypothetical protein